MKGLACQLDRKARSPVAGAMLRAILWRRKFYWLLSAPGIIAACSSPPTRASSASQPVAATLASESPSPAPAAKPSRAEAAYVAEAALAATSTQQPLLIWPPKLEGSVAPPPSCLDRRRPLARDCRFPGKALERLSGLLLDAYQESHPDFEQPRCESADKTRAQDPAKPTEALLGRTLDRNLAELEGCREFPRGFIRALRAHEDPECADALAELLLDAKSQTGEASPAQAPTVSPTARPSEPSLDGWLHQLLYGQALGARFERWFREPPARLLGAEPQQFDAWFTQVLSPYLAKGQRQLDAAKHVAELLPAGSSGRLVADEFLWRAEQRFLQNARRVEIPDRLKRDYRLRTQFYGKFDELTRSLADTQRRHGVELCLSRADSGWLDNEPYFWKPTTTTAAESGCSRFTWLPLPIPLAPRQDPRQTTDPVLRLLTALPPPFADAWLTDERRVAPETHQALLARGTPRSLRLFASAALASSDRLVSDPEALHLAMARSAFRLGLLYSAPPWLERAKHELAFSQQSGETRLLQALATSLLSAPLEPRQPVQPNPCHQFDLRPLREFVDASPAESSQLVSLANAAIARLTLDCPTEDFSPIVARLLEQARSAGAHYVEACWFERNFDARPFSVLRQFDCGDPRSYPCHQIPWQGR